MQTQRDKQEGIAPANDTYNDEIDEWCHSNPALANLAGHRLCNRLFCIYQVSCSYGQTMSSQLICTDGKLSSGPCMLWQMSQPSATQNANSAQTSWIQTKQTTCQSFHRGQHVGLISTGAIQPVCLYKHIIIPRSGDVSRQFSHEGMQPTSSPEIL